MPNLGPSGPGGHHNPFVRELVTTPLGIAFLGGLAALLAAGLRRRRGRPAGGWPFAALALAWATVMLGGWPPLAWWTESSLAALGEHWPAPPRDASREPEAILVFGGGLDGADEQAPLSDSSRERLLAALDAARRWPGAHLVFSGGAARAGRTGVAQRMAEEATRLGIPPSRITVESRARSTRENALFCAAIARERGWEHLVLVTSPVHLARSRASLARAGYLAAGAAPRLGHPGRWSVADMLPSAAALGRTTGSLHEGIGLVYYAARGWLESSASGRTTATSGDAAARSTPP